MPSTPLIFEPDLMYAVSMARPVKHRGTLYLPRHKHVMKGRFITKLVEEHGADAIADASLTV